MKLKHAFPALVTIFFPLVAHADWQWENDLATAAISPNQYRVSFRFENNGKLPVKVTDLTFSCPCIVYHFQSKPVAPGKSGILTIQIDRGDDEQAGEDLDLIVRGTASTTSRQLTIRVPTPPR
jgi:hypothetical protein